MNEDDGCGGIWYRRWQGVNYVNQMRTQWASVPYILLKKDSRETGNLVIFALDRGNSQRSENSVHYSGPCGSVLDSAVEHFFFFSCFCSTFSSVRIDLAEDMRPRGTAVHGKWCFGTHGHSFLAVVQLHPTRSHQSPAFYKNITSCFKYWISLK